MTTQQHITKANIGDTVIFEDKSMNEVKGEVIVVRENSVIVDIKNSPNFHLLEVEDHLTVVNHKHYTIVVESN